MSNKLKRLIKILQVFNDWTIAQVAESIGYTREHLTKLMNSNEEHPEIETLLKIKHGKILQNVNLQDDTPALTQQGSSNKTTKVGNSNLPADKQLSDREKYINLLEDNNRFFKRLLESSLFEISEKQLTLLAEIQAIQQWDAQMTSQGDEVKERASLDHIQQLSADNRRRLKKTGNAVVTGKRDK